MEEKELVALRAALEEIRAKRIAGLPISKEHEQTLINLQGRLGLVRSPQTKERLERLKKLKENEKKLRKTSGEPAAPKRWEYPPAIDWRRMPSSGTNKNWMTPAKNQNPCGACVAFATIGALEVFRKLDRFQSSYEPNYSEAFLFFCNNRQCIRGEPNYGWDPTLALDYIRDFGVPDDDCFTFTPVDQPCTACSDWKQRATQITGWDIITSADQMKNMLAYEGPLIACFDVYDDFYYFWDNYPLAGTIYRYSWGVDQGGHCVLVVGYDEATQCWICKNSWGDACENSGLANGTRGFFRIGYGQCGIDDEMYLIKGIQPPQPGILTGTVTTSKGIPIADASVKVQESDNDDPWIPTTKTNQSGNYSITLTDGRYHVGVVEKTDYEKINDDFVIMVPAGRTIIAPHALTLLRHGILTGTVTGEGAPLQNAQLLVYKDITCYELYDSIPTDGGGNYTITIHPPGVYYVRAEARGFKWSDPTSVTITLDSTFFQNINLVKPKPIDITGTVTDKDNKPIANLTVQCYNSKCTLVTQTGNDGVYKFTSDAGSGGYIIRTVNASKLGFVDSDEMDVTVPDGVTAFTYNFSLAKCGTIEGKVSGQLSLYLNLILAPGKEQKNFYKDKMRNIMFEVPISGADVYVSGSNFIGSVKTDTEGSYRIIANYSGDCTITVCAKDYGAQSATVHVLNGATTTHDFVLNRDVPGVIEGGVSLKLNKEMIPMQDVTVYSENSYSEKRTTTTDSKGHFKLVGVPSGWNKVTADNKVTTDIGLDSLSYAVEVISGQTTTVGFTFVIGKPHFKPKDPDESDAQTHIHTTN